MHTSNRRRRITHVWQATRGQNDPGDVPGWVMITIMTAAIVIAILAIARPQLRDAVGHAIDSVTSSSDDGGPAGSGSGSGGN